MMKLIIESGPDNRAIAMPKNKSERSRKKYAAMQFLIAGPLAEYAREPSIESYQRGLARIAEEYPGTFLSIIRTAQLGQETNTRSYLKREFGIEASEEEDSIELSESVLSALFNK